MIGGWVLRITVVGLGKIGLPLAAQYANKGHFVTGADISEATVETVNRGHEPFPGEFGLEQILSDSVRAGTLKATTKTTEAVSQSNVVVVAVPLFVDSNAEPAFSAMDAASRDIGRGLKAGSLVAYETTLPVGTTRNRLVPILERESGLVAGKDFFVVFSPERVLTGRVFEDLKKYPKLVGGIDPDSESKGIEFYEAVLDFDERKDLPKPNGVWPLGSAEAAEMAKLAETTYRDVNIALANQFATYAEKIGVDIYEVIQACNSQNFSHIHQPGVAVGGHCIPIYPHLYLHGDPDATVVSASRLANKSMPRHAVQLLNQGLGSLAGKKIVILGLTYRGGVKEHAFSGAWDLVDEVTAIGGIPLVHDPMYTRQEITELGLAPFELNQPCDGIIFQSNHAEYAQLISQNFPGAKFLVDGRNSTNDSLRSNIPHSIIGVGVSV
jgi:nucleotide sugar dehydrogenase